MHRLLLVLTLALYAGCELNQEATPQPASKVEVLDFYAPWCGPCKRFDPDIKRLEAKGWLVKRIDVDRRSDLASQWRINSLPTYIVTKNGREVGRASNPSQLRNILRGL